MSPAATSVDHTVDHTVDPAVTPVPEPALANGSTPTALLSRVSLLLEAFDGASVLTLAELTRRSRLPRSSAHRLLEQLVGLGWVSRVGNHYSLGMRICEIGTLVLHHNAVRQAAAPFLQELHRVSGLAVHLGVLDGADVIYLDRVGGTNTRLPTRIGGRLPAHATAIGKMLMASHGLPRAPERLARLTPRTITQPEQLEAVLDRARADRWCVEHGEGVLGISCAAVPLGAPNGEPAALSVSGPTEALRVDRLLPFLRETAQRIGQQLGQPSLRHAAP